MPTGTIIQSHALASTTTIHGIDIIKARPRAVHSFISSCETRPLRFINLLWAATSTNHKTDKPIDLYTN
jgi:hypothetical protein